MAKLISDNAAREIDLEAKRSGRPALRAPTAREYAERMRADRGSIRPMDGTYGRTETDRRLGDAATTALAAAAGATSLTAAAALLVPGVAKLDRDLEERGVKGLLDPANLMLLSGIRVPPGAMALRRTMAPLTASRRTSGDSFLRVLKDEHITLPSSGIHFRDAPLKVPAKGYNGGDLEHGAITIFPREDYVVPGLSDNRVATFMGDAWTPNTEAAFSKAAEPMIKWHTKIGKRRELYPNAPMHDHELMTALSESGGLPAEYAKTIELNAINRAKRTVHDITDGLPFEPSLYVRKRFGEVYAGEPRNQLVRAAAEFDGILRSAPELYPHVRGGKTATTLHFDSGVARHAEETADRLSSVLDKYYDILDDSQVDNVLRGIRMYRAAGTQSPTVREMFGGRAGGELLSTSMKEAMDARRDSFNALRDGNFKYTPGEPGGEYRPDYVDAMWRDLLTGGGNRRAFIGSLDGYNPYRARYALANNPGVRYLESKLYERVPIEEYAQGVAVRDSHDPVTQRVNDDIIGLLEEKRIPYRITDPDDSASLLKAQQELGADLKHMDAKGGKTRTGAEAGGASEPPAKRYSRQRLLDHVKKWEKMRPKPYLDVDGNYAIGYGSHFVGGKPVTKDTAAIDEATATAELVAYLTERENTLARFIPNWGRIPSDRQDMLLDVAMGKRGILSAETSSDLHRRLGATTDPAELSRIVDEEYPTYSKAGGEPSEGLANRRADGLNTLRVRQDSKGGEARADAEGGEVGPVPEETAGPEPIPPQPSGPRIVINPTTFRNRKDALCVAFNERFRIAMEQYGFEPRSEPTPAQRRFFADTAYADDEVQLRRTILARILTLDTSIS